MDKDQLAQDCKAMALRQFRVVLCQFSLALCRSLVPPAADDDFEI